MDISYVVSLQNDTTVTISKLENNEIAIALENEETMAEWRIAEPIDYKALYKPTG